MRMKKAVVAGLAAAFFAALLAYSAHIAPVITVTCDANDTSCMNDLEVKKDQCAPSSFIIVGRDGIRMMINITMEGDRCVRTEQVLDAPRDEDSYLIGRNLTCNYSLSEIGNASATACPGSLYDYAVPFEGQAGGVGNIFQLPKISCSMDDSECKDAALTYLDNCINSEIVSTEFKLNPYGYWTAYIRVTRLPEICRIYFEVLNAVNLPPGIPASIIGTSMVCNVPLSEMPIDNLTKSSCTGELFNYVEVLSY